MFKVNDRKDISRWIYIFFNHYKDKAVKAKPISFMIFFFFFVFGNTPFIPFVIFVCGITRSISILIGLITTLFFVQSVRYGIFYIFLLCYVTSQYELMLILSITWCAWCTLGSHFM